MSSDPLLAKRWTLWASAAAVLAVAIVHQWLAAPQQPTSFWDSSAYIEAAKQPLSWSHFYYPKPIVTALVYRVIGGDLARVVVVQELLSCVAWTALAVALVSRLHTRAARGAAVAACVVFVLDPIRIGYCDAILSESINDSLLALVLAGLVGAVGMSGRLRRALLCGTTAVAVTWVFTRDTNAVTALAALVLLAGYHARRVRRFLLEAGLGVVVAVASAFTLWSSTVAPAPTGLTFTAGWAPSFTARSSYPMLDNLLDRVIPEPATRAVFVDAGLPMADELVQPNARLLVLGDPRFEPVRDWLNRRGRTTWIRWVASHPFDRLAEQGAHFWQLLGLDRDEQHLCMPDGWRGHTAFPKTRGLLSSRVVVALLLLAFPFAVYLARRDPLVPLSLVLVASGWLGSVAAYYGDTAEIARHCYASGQQCVFGALLAVLVAVAAARARAATRSSVSSAASAT